MSCEKNCLLCHTLQKYKVNPARYHGVCQNHSTQIKNTGKCNYCNSIVPILFIELGIICSLCNEICSCSYSSCDHIICENCFNSGKYCEKCITIKPGAKCEYCLERDIMKNSCCITHKICEVCAREKNLCPLCEIHSDDSEKKLKIRSKKQKLHKKHKDKNRDKSKSSSRNQRTSIGLSSKSENTYENENKGPVSLAKSDYYGFQIENEEKMNPSKIKINFIGENRQSINMKKNEAEDKKFQSADSSSNPKMSIIYESIGEKQNIISVNSNPVEEINNQPADKLNNQDLTSRRTNDSDTSSTWNVKINFRCIVFFIIYCLTCCWNFGICFNYKLEGASNGKSRFWYCLSCLYLCKHDSENYKIWKYFLRCTFCEIPTMSSHRLQESGGRTDLLNSNIVKNA
ncbi:hypothetical protein SteCoe_18073 [Stentor coeruleus]|uniref:Uncharacterized protein n=1 Tax=Stentor coeruleus TaxID=5963 RepID=A0A1R2BXF7_9CILI|nr:hypothetical protein SteCoe_18073 [Stentor coeruleus]